MSLKSRVINNREWLLIESGALGKKTLDIFTLDILSLLQHLLQS